MAGPEQWADDDEQAPGYLDDEASIILIALSAAFIGFVIGANSAPTHAHKITQCDTYGITNVVSRQTCEGEVQ